ncbi:radical SAM family heme chaperone HemW [Algicola sagamiensis]|uniref:radical SAM family heme chaperone HemW n=1 Tax=Algicola sagamiensis TaxID=163869 RepID=UPI00037D35ED|nr:radical SAM family heme chaperone HemW [Algicola sagamiensis]
MQLPPLSLYIHIPWCVQKCPYCDFNSHAQKGVIPEQEYIAHLLHDLEQDLKYVQGRTLETIFIGGGTPSLFSAEGMAQLLNEIQSRVPFAPNIEITMEANPGTAEAKRFQQYYDAGLSRLSMGIQSLQSEKLIQLGRIHGPEEALNAIQFAKDGGFQTFNVDLMHGLPNQSMEDALYDLKTAIDTSPPHLSWYQLTIEPNTLFYSKPPTLPEDELLWDIQEQGHQLLLSAGFEQYEISGYAKPGHQCQHNLNYWRFGDYLGIGCGAHGKISFPNEGTILRTVKVKHPKGYMDLAKPYLYQSQNIETENRPFEFFMNRFRLVEPCPKDSFSTMTGLPLSMIETPIKKALAKGLLKENQDSWQVTPTGSRYLNELLTLFIE